MKEYIIGYNVYGGGFIQNADGVGYFLLDSDEIDEFVADAPESRGLEFWEASNIDDLARALETGRRRFRTARFIA